jgi:DNA-directed RNA polymerase subunit RPC12/RpoP
LKCLNCGAEFEENPYLKWRRQLSEENPKLGYVASSRCPKCGAAVALEAKGIPEEGFKEG